MHEFTISVPVLVLPVFRQLLHSEHRVQTADNSNSTVTSQVLQLTLVLYIFKLVLYFISIIINNHIKCHLAINRWLFSADTVWLLQACFAKLLSAIGAFYWKSMYLWRGWSCEIVNAQDCGKDWYLTSCSKYTDTDSCHL